MILFKDTGDTHMRIEVSGKVTKADYEELVPRIEKALEGGRTRLLIGLHSFEGWTLGAAWEDLKFDIRHRSDFDKIAVIGEKRWEKWGTRLTRPFFSGEVRYFDADRAEEAKAWLLFDPVEAEATH